LGYQTSENALNVSEKSGDSYSKAVAYNTHGSSCFYMGFFNDSKKYFKKGLYFSELSDIRSAKAIANIGLGDIYLNMKKYEKSIDQYLKGIVLLENSKISAFRILLCKLKIALAKVKNNEKDIDVDLLYSNVANIKPIARKASSKRILGEILFYLNDKYIKEAEDLLKQAINGHMQYGIKFSLAQDYLFYHKLNKQTGDKQKSYGNLIKSIEIFKECGADGWVKKSEEYLTVL
jgi:tetratricopeptide (TPR) repeat protein